ncbi:hypothetical protein SAMN03159428_04947 [Kosakonia radicincitans]|uniref:Uncharacterized protein n=1 Tax=Kosakonia radicincitans TaxID=283686 RepID=A0AAX2EZ96_9ENTR|nr:hypothetical protein [Kosakonia radicincitans]SFF38510.1 hypothetical protein SAMN03159468_04974 [Kosakonia radicincitans]SFR26323.1 hypothetical protein SAMN03159514_04934 [Kosakonia radicincitans]SFU16849.1 hypothetical protein SAMN03159428_04947 [Kosakonia radicincitans]SFY32360.1 hypothetical protein SAMN03159436_04924 [Kosakonia radicincitans]
MNPDERTRYPWAASGTFSSVTRDHRLSCRTGLLSINRPFQGSVQKEMILTTFMTDPQADALSRSLDSACLITCLNIAAATSSLSALLLLTAVENLSTAGFVVKVTMALLFPVSTVYGIFHLLKYLRLLREGPVSGENR